MRIPSIRSGVPIPGTRPGSAVPGHPGPPGHGIPAWSGYDAPVQDDRREPPHGERTVVAGLR